MTSTNPREEYDLHITVEIKQVSVHNGYRQSNYNNSLRVNHEMSLGVLDFLELAKVLARFHELGETIRAEKPAS